MQPGDIYTHVVFDGHPDHAAVAREVARAVLRSSLTVTVHGTLIHETGNASCQADTAAWWPNPELVQRSRAALDAEPAVCGPADLRDRQRHRIRCLSGLLDSAGRARLGAFGPPTEVPVPADMQLTDLTQNEKWQTISQYDSQLGCPAERLVRLRARLS